MVIFDSNSTPGGWWIPPGESHIKVMGWSSYRMVGLVFTIPRGYWPFPGGTYHPPGVLTMWNSSEKNQKSFSLNHDIWVKCHQNHLSNNKNCMPGLLTAVQAGRVVIFIGYLEKVKTEKKNQWKKNWPNFLSCNPLSSCKKNKFKKSWPSIAKATCNENVDAPDVTSSNQNLTEFSSCNCFFCLHWVSIIMVITLLCITLSFTFTRK